MISIVVPVFNGEKTLARCVDSLLNQTISDIEVLIIDDGSTDGSVSVAKKLAKKDSRIRVFSQSQKGVSTARNRGIGEAEGLYVSFVDCDDWIEPDMLEKLLSISARGTLPVCNFVHNDSEIAVLKDMKNEYEIDKGHLAEDYLIGSLGKSIAFSVCNKLFELKCIRQNHIHFPSEVRIGEDMLFVLAYLNCCERIKSIDEGMYHYSISHSSSMNSTARDYLPAYCKTYEELKRFRVNDAQLPSFVLDAWALDVISIILCTKHVTDMKYRDFYFYSKRMRSTSIVECASHGKTKTNLKKRILACVLKIKSSFLLYALVKANMQFAKR